MGENPFLILIKFLYKHFKLLSIVFVLSLVITYLGMRLFITPKYLSEAVIYPANIHTLSSEDETEHVMQVLASTDIKSKMIDSFNLIAHYGFSSEKVNYDNLSKKYDRHIKVERTPYASISITVLDIDKDLAASMANAVVALLNRKILKMRREKYKEWVSTAKQKLDDKKSLIASIEAELNKIKSENGIINLSEQSANVAIQLNKSVATKQEAEAKIEVYGKYSSAKYKDSVIKYSVAREIADRKVTKLDSLFNKMLRVGDRIVGLTQNLELERETMAEYKAEYEEHLQSAKRKITYSFIISSAGPADKPHYPKKVVSASLTAFSVTFLLILYLIIVEQFRKIKDQLS